MDQKVQHQIVQFNLLFKRYDDIYRSAAKKFDMPELALWVLYALREKPDCTQKDLVDLLLQPKQSIHTALKGLINDGYVVLENQKIDRRSKLIRLTERGTSLAENSADQIVQAENRAFLTLTAEERKTILRLFEQLTNEMQNEMQKIPGEPLRSLVNKSR